MFKHAAILAFVMVQCLLGWPQWNGVERSRCEERMRRVESAPVDVACTSACCESETHATLRATCCGEPERPCDPIQCLVCCSSSVRFPPMSPVSVALRADAAERVEPQPWRSHAWTLEASRRLAAFIPQHAGAPLWDDPRSRAVLCIWTI